MPPPNGLLDQATDPDGPGYWGQTARNIYPSAKGLLGDLYQMVRHPIQTVGGLFSLGHSLINLARPGEQGNEELAKAVGEYFVDRYGSAENLKNTLRDDPSGLAADVALLLAGGAGAAAKVGGKTGQLASAVQRAARVVDPAALAVRGATGATRLARQGAARVGTRAGETLSQVAGLPSGVGHLPLEAAYRAGRAGGEAMENLLDAMRKRVPTERIDEQIVQRANASLARLGEARRAAYQKGMGNLSALRVDLSPLKQKIQVLYDQWRVGPERTLREGEPGVQRLRAIEKKIAEFEDLDATSVPDLDALKREIDALMGEASTGAGRSANAVTSTVRNELRAEIIRVDPEYKAIMEGYEAAIKLERELGKDLGLAANATDQAALRKLSQSLRDGVNANFGGRARQVQQLDPQLTNLIAGRTLSPAVPHGMARFATVPAAGAVGMALAGPKGLAAMLAGSPRVVGEAALGAGRVARGTPDWVRGAGQMVGPFATGYVGAAGEAARVARPVVQGVDQARRGMRPVNTAVQEVQQTPPRRSETMSQAEIEEEFERLRRGLPPR